MSKFSVGEVVLINIPGNDCHNFEATILRTDRGVRSGDEGSVFGFLYVLEIAGVGRMNNGREFACFENELRKRPDDQPFTSWAKEHLIPYADCAPSLEESMKTAQKNLASYTQEGSCG